MATARISESLWTCAKRWGLEAAITKAGHKWGPPRLRAPMSGAECISRVLAFLDQRSRPDGDMTDLDADAVENAAGWTGEQGVLAQCLVDAGWIDMTPAGMFWHDYGAFNGQTIRDRLKKRSKRGWQGSIPGGHKPDISGDAIGDQVGDSNGDVTGDSGGDEVGASESGSGSGYGSESHPPKPPLGGGAFASLSRRPRRRDRVEPVYAQPGSGISVEQRQREQDLRAKEDARAEADKAAFIASGYESRSEYLRDKNAGCLKPRKVAT